MEKLLGKTCLKHTSNFIKRIVLFSWTKSSIDTGKVVKQTDLSQSCLSKTSKFQRWLHFIMKKGRKSWRRFFKSVISIEMVSSTKLSSETLSSNSQLSMVMKDLLIRIDKTISSLNDQMKTLLLAFWELD